MLKCIASVPKDSLLLGLLRKNQDPWNTLANSLAQLYQSNVALAWRQVFSHLPSVGCIDLPLYPLARNKFWVAYKESDAPAPSQAVVVQPAPQVDNLISEYAMLHAWAQEWRDGSGEGEWKDEVECTKVSTSACEGWMV